MMKQSLATKWWSHPEEIKYLLKYVNQYFKVESDSEGRALGVRRSTSAG